MRMATVIFTEYERAALMAWLDGPRAWASYKFHGPASATDDLDAAMRSVREAEVV